MINDFIAYDGEGLEYKDEHRLILLANSNNVNEYIFDRKGLDFYDCIDFLDKHHKKKNVWFAFNYDINMIFKYAPIEIQEKLFQEGEVRINNYHIKYIPRKILTIKNLNTRNNVTHYDTWGFFQGSFMKALDDWNVKYSKMIEKGKKERVDFTKWEDEKIRAYNYEECVLLVELMLKLQSKLEVNNINLSSWHGAGAISSFFLKKVDMRNHKPKEIDRRLNHARKYAYFGGRIELFKRGYYTDIHHYDINSAYPYACMFLPSLRDKKFHYIDKISEGDLDKDSFALIECTWDTNSKIGCLPFRLSPSNMVVFPSHGHGFYHWCEIQEAIKKGYNINMGQAFVLEKPYTYPLRDYLKTIMRKRLEYKKNKDKAHIPLKLGANGLYGKLAQKPTRKNKDDSWFIPEYHELLWAGFITAKARSMLLQYSNPETTVLMATDGLFSQEKLKCPIGTDLGEWEYEFHPQTIFMLAGIYGYTDNTNKWSFKKRGYKNLDVKRAYRLARKGIHVELTDTRFISLKLGLKQKVWKGGEFVAVPRVVNWNNNRKRDFLNFDGDSESYPTDNLEGQTVSSPYKVGGMELEDEIKEELEMGLDNF